MYVHITYLATQLGGFPPKVASQMVDARGFWVLECRFAKVRYCASLIAKLQTYRERVAPHRSPPASSASSGVEVGHSRIIRANRTGISMVSQWYFSGTSVVFRCFWFVQVSIEIMFNPDCGSRLDAWNWGLVDQTEAKPAGIWVRTKDALRSAQNIPPCGTSYTDTLCVYINMYIYIYIYHYTCMIYDISYNLYANSNIGISCTLCTHIHSIYATITVWNSMEYVIHTTYISYIYIYNII